jgi:hypothetical protein
MTVIKNKKNELILKEPSLVGRCALIIESLTRQQRDHFLLPFIDEMLERLTNHSFFYFLDGYSGYL